MTFVDPLPTAACTTLQYFLKYFSPRHGGGGSQACYKQGYIFLIFQIFPFSDMLTAPIFLMLVLLVIDRVRVLKLQIDASEDKTTPGTRVLPH